MEVRVLGTVDVAVDGRDVEIRAPQLRSLLARLAVAGGAVVSTEDLARDVLGDQDDARQSVKTYVSRLRKELAAAGVDDLVRTAPPGYALRTERGAVDCYRFEALVRDARHAIDTGRYEEAAVMLDEALALWRGAPFADVADRAYVRLERIRLEELWLVAVESRHEVALTLGRAAESVPELEVLVRRHPLRERFWAQLMRALYETGRQAAALRAYQDARRLLVEELGVEPGHELRDLERAIIDQGLPPARVPRIAERPAAPVAPAAAQGGARRTQPAIRLLLVDDHPMWRETVRALLERTGDVEVVAEAGTSQEAVTLAAQTRPDLVLMDLHLPDATGSEAAARIRAARSAGRVLMLSASDVAADVLGAVRAGAVGYVVKSAGAAELTDAVRRAAAGEAVFGGALADLVLGELRSSERSTVPESDGELQVLTLVARGAAPAEVAAQLAMTERAVREVLAGVVQRLHASAIGEATAPPVA